MSLIEVSGLTKTYHLGEIEVPVLRGCDVSVAAGEMLAIEGKSGSGKSTLLHLMGLLDDADGGSVTFDGRDAAAMTGAERAAVRNGRIGFVFQHYHLLPELDVLQNTLTAAMVGRGWWAFRRERAALTERAVNLLGRLGLGERVGHRAAQLSGGERQRVAIARALMNSPDVLLADEPTGNLDAETGGTIMDVLRGLHADGQTIVMVTHDHEIARGADRALFLKNGRFEAAS